MDDPFAASLLIDPTAIYTPSPMSQASPFRAPASPMLRDEQENDVSEDEASEDSETDEDDDDDKHATDPPPMQTSKRVTKTSLWVNIPGPDTSMRTMSTFACSPALATAGLINFETKEGQSLYRAAVEKLPSQFSLKNPNVNLLINQLRIRVRREGWGSIVLIHTDKGPINILEHPHLVTLKQVQKHVNRFATTETRSRQNDAMLFGCLVSSLDDHTLTIMSSMRAHEFRNHEDPFSEPHESRVTYFKLLLDRAEYNSQAVVANLQVELSQLHLVIGSQFRHDIPSFHRHVEALLQQLTSRRIPFSHVKSHLIRAYDTVPSQKFTNMIDHLSSTRKFAKMDVFEFMLQAKAKYNELVALGTWNKQDKVIMALQADIASLRQQHTSVPNASNNIPSVSTTTVSQQTKGRNGRKYGADGRPVFKDTQQWRYQPPAKGAVHVQRVNDKDYSWCAKHGYWVIGTDHMTVTCRKKGPDFSFDSTPTASGTSSLSAAVTIAEALPSVSAPQE